MAGPLRRPRAKRNLIVEVDSVFARGRKKADMRRIGEARMEEFADTQWNLTGGTPVHECTDTALALVKLDRSMASAASIRRYTLMDPVLFFYVVAVAEDALRRNPHMLLMDDEGGDGPRMHDAGRRAKLQARHIILVYLRYAKTNMSQHEVGLEFGIGQKTVSRYIKLAKKLLAGALPTPLAYARHIRGLKDPREVKKCLPGPGRGACIEDGTLCRMQRPGQKKSRSDAYNGRKKMHAGNTVFRFNLRGEAVSMSPTVNGTVNDVTMCRNHPLDLGLATSNIRDKDAPPGDRFHRIEDHGFRGIENDEPGAAYERTAGYKTLQKMDEAGRERNAEISRKRLAAEWFFGRMKRYKLVAGPYAGTYSELNEDLNIVAGLVNLHLMCGGVKEGSGHAKKPEGKRVRRHHRNLDRDKRMINKAAGVLPEKKAKRKARKKRKK